jgi:uncharacterized membrane protein
MAWLDQVLGFLGFAVCHCLPSRTFIIGGRYLPLCSRCTGVFLGIAATYIFLIVRRGFKVNALPSLPVSFAVAAMLLPMAVDGLSSYAGLRETTNIVRFLTGLAAGAALPVFAFPLLSRELVVDGPSVKAVRPFGRVLDYPIWLAVVAAAGALVLTFWPWLYYPISVLVALGLVGIFFTLSLAIWEMALERAGRWGRRPWTLVAAAFTVLLVFSLLNIFHYFAFSALAEAGGGELPR